MPVIPRFNKDLDYFQDVSDVNSRVTILENNEYKVLYWASVNTGTGAVSVPTGATVVLADFPSGINAITETIVGGKPSGYSAKDAGGNVVSVSSFDTSGNYTLSGTPTAYPIAILYILQIKAKDWGNLNLNNVIAAEVIYDPTGTGVSSVALALPTTLFDITGSPVTSSGTLAGTFKSFAQALVFASPSGASGTPSMRALVASDIPSLSGSYIPLTGTVSPITGDLEFQNNKSLVWNNGDIQSFIKQNDENAIELKSKDTVGLNNSSVSISPSSVDILYSDVTSSSLSIQPFQFVVDSGFNEFSGIKYAQDFSANFTTQSLPNLGYIQSNFQPLSNNLTSLSGLTYASASFVKMTAAGTFALDTASYLSSVSGTTNRITVTGGNTIDIAATYVGQSSITTVGTLISGATGAGFTIDLGASTEVGQLPSANGGTGVNNGTSTITIGGNLTFNGAFTTTFTVTGNTSLTLPTSGTLATGTGTNTQISYWSGTNTLASSGNFTYSSGVLTVLQNGIAATYTNGLFLNNTTAATSGVQVQQSPSIELRGTAWDTTNLLANTSGARITFVPTAQAGSTRGALVFDFYNGTTYNNILTYNNGSSPVWSFNNNTVGGISNLTATIVTTPTLTNSTNLRNSAPSNTVTSTATASSGANILWDFGNTFNTSGTGGATSVRLSTYLQALGSGTHRLFDVGTNTAVNGGGTHTSVFNISSNGSTNIVGLVNTAGWTPVFTVTGAADTGRTAATEFFGAQFNFAQSIQWAAGTTAVQRQVVFQAPTYTGAAATATFTDAATVAITGAPTAGTNAAITRAISFWVQTGTSRFDGNITSRGANRTWGTEDGFTLALQTNGTARYTLGTTGAHTFTSSALNGTTFVTFTQAVSTSGSSAGLLWTGAAHTGQTASTELTDINFNLARTVTLAAGTVATQRAFRIQAPTYAGSAATANFTTAATLAISNAPQQGTNAAITTALALWVENGNSRFSGLEVQMRHLRGVSTAPTIAAGVGAGTTPTVSLTGTDLAGIVTVTTGTTPTGSNAIVVTVTFNTAYSVAPFVVLTPANRNALALGTGTEVCVPASGQTNGVTTTTFVIESGATALAASTQYIWTYMVIQ